MCCVFNNCSREMYCCNRFMLYGLQLRPDNNNDSNYY